MTMPWDFTDIFLLVMGLAMAGFGARLAGQRIAFLRRTRRAWGKLDGWKEQPSLRPGSREIYYYAEVVFDAADGTTHRVTSATGDGRMCRPSTPIGKPVPVRYNPENPDEASIDTFFNLWAPSLGFLVIGGACLFAFYDRHFNGRSR